MAGTGGANIAGNSGNAGATTGGSAGASGSGGAGGLGGGGGAGMVGTCTPPSDVFSPITKLSLTGCVDATDPKKPIARAVSYEVNSPLWSDSADKARAFVLPVGGKIHVRDCAANAADCPNGTQDNGRWDFPVGTVMIKEFMFDGKLVETRLFMHNDAQNWVGYSYEWDEQQTEATITSPDRVDLMFNTGKRTVEWHYPSQQDCLNCHNAAAGSTLGPETAQMNRMVGGMNQIDKIAALGLFEKAPAMPYKAALTTPYATSLGMPQAGATVEEKARSYLHANCSFCHRPGGNYPNFDFRYDTALKDMAICNAVARKGGIASAPDKTLVMVPGKEADSLMWLRMSEANPDKGRMPQVGSYAVDADGVKAVGDWIDSLTACP